MKNIPLLASAITIVSLLTLTPTSQATDWTRFRGPNGSGVSTDTELVPTQFGPTQNVKWKAPLPGPGVSCPIVVGNKIFLTCYTGYGTSRDDLADITKLTRHLVCIDRSSGQTLWKSSVPGDDYEDPYAGMGVPEHGYASHTPTSDGQSVFAFFGKSGVYAYSLDGKERWHRVLGIRSDDKRWGSASSPILFNNLLIVPAGAEDRALYALDKATGEIVWRNGAETLGNVWSTPLIATINDQRSDIILAAPFEFWGLNPADGKLRWFCTAIETESFNTSPVLNNGVIYAVEGRSGGSVAIQAGGERKDVSDSNVLWSGRDLNRFASPLVDEKFLYYIANNTMTCLDKTNGKQIYRARLRPSDDTLADELEGRPQRGSRGADYASPVIANNHIFYTSASGEVYVFDTGDQFNQIAVNRVTNDPERFSATPAISQGQLFLRSDKSLYCISQ